MVARSAVQAIDQKQLAPFQMPSLSYSVQVQVDASRLRHCLHDHFPTG